MKNYLLELNKIKENKQKYLSELTEAERDELGEKIAGGDIFAIQDWQQDGFRISLSTGKLVSGRYKWGSEFGEFVTFEVQATKDIKENENDIL